MPKASVIIVTLNGRDLLRESLTSLSNLENISEPEIIIVDNGSNDGTSEMLRAEFPSALVIPLPSNHGFAPAVNIGAKEARGDYIVLLNNDCRVHPDWLLQLLNTFEEHPDAACVGSLVLDAKGEKVDFMAGEANIFGWGFQKGRGDDPPDGKSPFRTFFACGAACAFRKNIYFDAGGLLDETFAYFEDVEFGWRLNALGYEVWINPASVVEHHHGATVKHFGQGFHSFLKERNSLINAWCNLAPDEAGVIIPLCFSLAAIRLMATGGLRAGLATGEGYRDVLAARGEEFIAKGSELKDLLKRLKSVMDPYGDAHLDALSDFGRLIPKLANRKASLQQKRKKSTRELLDLMGNPFRAVIGHPDEEAFIEELKPFILETI